MFVVIVVFVNILVLFPSFVLQSAYFYVCICNCNCLCVDVRVNVIVDGIVYVHDKSMPN